MEALALVIIKAVVGTFVKYYTAILLSGSSLVYSEKELGYKVPRWYLNPGHATTVMYAYGTSTEGDAFQSIEYARRAALKQMAETIRLGNRKMVSEQVSYDKKSLKQKRLIELFIRGDGLEDFIRTNVKMDKKQLVKMPDGDMRAFVRISLNAKVFAAWQKKEVKELKSKIVHQKTDDILAEMEAEIAAANQGLPKIPPEKIAATNPPPAHQLAPEQTKPSPNVEDFDIKLQPHHIQGSGFDDLERELDESGE